MDRLGISGHKTVNSFVDAQIKLLSRERSLRNIFAIVSSCDNVFAERLRAGRIVSTTYRESAANVKRLAANLSAEFSALPKNSCVGIHMANSPEWIEVFWATLMIGFRPVLMNTRLSADKLEELLIEANAVAVISDGEFFSIKTVLITAALAATDRAVAEDWADEVLIMSSGSSDRIKLCSYTGESFYEQILNTRSILLRNKHLSTHYKGRLKVLMFLPLYHIFGLFACYFWFSFFGRTFVFLKDYSPDIILKTIVKHEVTHIFAVPLFWNKIYSTAIKTIEERGEKTVKRFNRAVALSNRLQDMGLGTGFARLALGEVRRNIFGDSVKFMISGGGAIGTDVLRFFNGIGYHLCNGYGMTEVGIAAVELARAPSQVNRGSIGSPLASLDFKLDGGELFIRGSSTAKRIICAGETILDDWLATGDLATEKDGRYYISGRKDDLIVSASGEKISPDLFEASLNVKGAETVCLLSTGGETLLIVGVKRFISHKGALAVRQSAIDSLRQNRLEGEVGRIVLTDSPLIDEDDFKVNRRRLRERFERGEFNILSTENPSDFAPSEYEHELVGKIKRCFAEALGTDDKHIKQSTDFFLDHGGTSIDYFTLLYLIQRDFGVEVKTEGLPMSTVKSVAEYIFSKGNT